MNIAKQIEVELKKIAVDLKFEGNPKVDIASDVRFGDYTTNFPLQAFKTVAGTVPGTRLHGEWGMAANARDLAEKIADLFNRLKPKYLDHAEAAGPGFVNFYISQKELSNHLERLLEPSKKTATAGQSVHTEQGRSALVEFTDANPFKEMHIGHLYSNIVGESTARTLELRGFEVKRLSYQGDVGLHVAKAIHGMILKLKHDDSNLKSSLEKLEKESLDFRMKFLGEAYAIGSKDFEENEEAREEIIALNKRIYTKDPEIWDLYTKGREWSLEKFDKIYDRLGTKFDKLYFESEVAEEGMNIVRSHIKDGVFEESDGALIFDGEKYGLHKRVFINSLHLPTYEAKELGLAVIKAKDFSFDLSIIVTAKEVSDYFMVLFKAISLIEPEIAGKTKHVGHGFVKLKEGKMSSRSGNVLTAEWLLDKVVARVKKEFSDMDSETSEKVGVGAIKYSLQRFGIGKDVAFDIEESISLEGNSGPYLQYTYVRCQSVLKKRKTKKGQLVAENLSIEEDRLLRKLTKFEHEYFFTEDFSQHLLCTYLYELASDFNLFYQKCQILDSKNETFRLALTEATSVVLAKGLYLLGIETPEKM